MNVWSASPPPFCAVTVTVVIPTATGVTVTTDPDTVTVATPGFDETAEYISRSPENASSTCTGCGDCPFTKVTSSRRPTRRGASRRGFRTVTENSCCALLVPLVAVTVTLVIPGATGVTVTTDPETETVAAAMFDDTAEYLSRLG